MKYSDVYNEYISQMEVLKGVGMSLRDYLRYRKLAFALKDIRDTEEGILDIAVSHGFLSHEVFTRAFKEAYGIVPSEYRKYRLF